MDGWIGRQQPLLIVVSGPSGVGKDTVLQRMRTRGLAIHFVVTATTRPRRPGETHGKDYLFVSQDRFREMIERGELLEHALVYNDYKGIPRQQVRQALDSGKDAVLRIDVQGAETIRRLCPGALLIFLAPETEEELVERLMRRSTESPDRLELRIHTAREEMKRVDLFDYVVINRDGQLEATVDTLLAIIVAEHHRTHPPQVTL